MFTLYYNFGHRCSGGIQGYREHGHLSENSIQALEACLTPNKSGKILQYDDSFLYLEFDIRETLDHEIVVFHDSALFTRLINPESEHNKKALLTIFNELCGRVPCPYRSYNDMIKKIGVKDLTLAQLRSLLLSSSPKKNTASSLLPAVVANKSKDDIGMKDGESTRVSLVEHQSSDLEDGDRPFILVRRSKRALTPAMNDDDNESDDYMESVAVDDVFPMTVHDFEYDTNAVIMTLEEALDACCRWDLRRPMMVEIKNLYTDHARQHLLNLLQSYMFRRKSEPSYKIIPSPMYPNIPILDCGVGLIAFPITFCNSFGIPGSKKWKYWSQKIYDVGLGGVRMSGVHHINLCFPRKEVKGMSAIKDDAGLDVGINYDIVDNREKEEIDS